MVGAGAGRWPLIPIHAVLLGDGRVLTYGTDGSGKQTGYFIYDVWSPGYNAANPGASRRGAGPQSGVSPDAAEQHRH